MFKNFIRHIICPNYGHKNTPDSAISGAINADDINLSLEDYEKIQPITTIELNGYKINFLTPNLATEWRAKTLFSKEPDTIEWIEKFKSDEIMIDIGANIGCYSLWAAISRNVLVFSFEPESQNYALLNSNIALNDINSKVIAFCIALTDESKFDRLHLRAFKAGFSGHSFGKKVSYDMRPMNPVFSQGSFSTTLDELIATETIPQPHHIKIDVDGFEHKVIEGAKNTIMDHRLRSMLIEINHAIPEHVEILEFVKGQGFVPSFWQVNSNNTEIASNSPHGAGNYTFWR